MDTFAASTEITQILIMDGLVNSQDFSAVKLIIEQVLEDYLDRSIVDLT